MCLITWRLKFTEIKFLTTCYREKIPCISCSKLKFQVNVIAVGKVYVLCGGRGSLLSAVGSHLLWVFLLTIALAHTWSIDQALFD